MNYSNPHLNLRRLEYMENQLGWPNKNNEVPLPSLKSKEVGI